MATRTGVLVIACLGVSLAACGEQRLATSELVVATRAIAVEPGRSLVALPPGGPPIVAVTQRSYDNAISQEIKLVTRGATPGENAVYAAFFTAADLPDGDGVAGNLLKVPGIADDAVAREMDERLPGVVMAPSAVFVQNKYGPFGYAFGRGAGGDACIYAWQRLMPGDSIFRPKSGVVSVRIRVCDPRASEASLLRLAYDYAINASLARSGWTPVGNAPPPPANLGKAGAPIYPFAKPGFGDASEPRQAPRARAAGPPRRAPSRAEPTETLAPERRLEGYPTVPPPPANP